ncbi:MAG: hypothetical protein M1837_002328 [Sclerophora amabilis]|nr:MAG: hypothetical protein M1837_002328 [Sclerophora amabilis]
MKFSNITAALIAAAGLASAAPMLAERQAAPALTDDIILNFALTLEHLESTFYRQGLKNFTQQQFADAGFDETFYKQLTVVASDEKTHVDFLTKAITAAGKTPVQECTYNFPVTDPKSFVVVSSILEGVGTSAYLGAAAAIISKDTLTAAGSILTVEARHSSIIRKVLKQDPIAQPFDTPLSPTEVFTLAAPFIASCPPDNPELPLKPFPAISLDPSTPTPIQSGSKVTILTPGFALKPADGSAPLFGAWITVTGPLFVDASPVDGGFELQVPDGINGQSYVVFTASKEKVTDDTVVAGPALVEITNAIPQSSS